MFLISVLGPAVTFMWVLWHRWFVRNDKANKLASEGVETPFTGLGPVCEIG